MPEQPLWLAWLLSFRGCHSSSPFPHRPPLREKSALALGCRKDQLPQSCRSIISPTRMTTFFRGVNSPPRTYQAFQFHPMQRRIERTYTNGMPVGLLHVVNNCKSIELFPNEQAQHVLFER